MMFEQITLADNAGRNKPWSFAASITAQSVLVAAALTLPMLHVAQLETKMPVSLYLPRAIGSLEPVRQANARSGAPNANLLTQPLRTYKTFVAPSRIPTRVSPGPDLPGTPIYGFEGGGGGGAGNNIDLSGLVTLPYQPLAVPPPTPPRPVAQAPAQQPPFRVGSGVQAAKLEFGPKPVYPPLAKQARISGTVMLAAHISTDGHIQNLRVISGHPMLVQAAIEAVRQWVYRPTLLNGQPVEVLTDIQVNFALQ
jgi:protein TonB